MSAATRDSGKGGRRFTTTQWSIVLAAADSQNPDSRAALAALCKAYWYPIYAQVRFQGASADKAQDLTQDFFANLLEKRFLRVARPDRGRFRYFLKQALRFHLANVDEKEKAQKRGSGKSPLALDLSSAESQYKLEPAHPETPETLFEKRWARTLLTNSLQRLKEEMQESSSLERFTRLEPFLTGHPHDIKYSQLAVELGMSESAVKVAVHRMRRRFGAIVRDEVARTVSGPEKVDEELRYLFSILDA